MRLLNKSAFTLGCLILLMAFVAVPVMAHQVQDDQDPPQDISGHAVVDEAHPVVKSMTLKGDAADGYVDGDSFLIDIVFEAANETNKITAPTLANIALDEGDFTTVEILQKSPTLFEARLRAGAGATSGEVTTVNVEVGSNNIYTPADPVVDGADDATMNPAKATVIFDNEAPEIGADGETDQTGPALQALGGRFTPLNGEWADPFRLVFQIVGADMDLSFDQTTITKASFSAEPNEVTFGNPGSLANNMYGVDVTPNPNTGTSNKAKVDVTITITLTDKSGNSTTAMVMVTLAARAGTGTITPDPPDTDPDPQPDTPETGDPMGITVPAKSYVLVSKSGAAMGLPTALADNASQVEWGQIPDLEDLLYRGGTILLTHVKADKVDHDGDGAAADADGKTAPREAKHRDIVITEIMWALNTAEIGKDGETARQWIEIYNNLSVDVTATISGKYGRPASSASSAQVMLDRVSNVVSAGWRLEGLGQNGFYDDEATTSDTDFISMYRKERGKDGWVKGHWAQSSEIYLAGHKGTPGSSERGAVGTIGPTSFDVGAIVFNEIGNRNTANKAYEWIELRNKSGGEQNLKKWQISMVTAVGTDNVFFNFRDEDRKIAAGGILLLVASDPTGDPDHPLAGGWNVRKGGNDQDEGYRNRGRTHDYLIADFAGDGLPDDGKFVLILRSGNDKRSKPEKLVDIAGYDDNLKVSANEAGFTNLWPLKGGVQDAQHNRNKFDVNTVHRRQKDSIWGTSATRRDRTHDDDAAFRGVGWRSGIGYKRNVAENNAHGGTPGYPHGAEKNEGGDATGPILISEIMYNTSDGLPQWIELQNTSRSVGVRLQNWRLYIVNHSQNADGSKFDAAPLEYNISLNGYEIPPNQTILIVSDGTRRDATNLPSSRINNRNLDRDKVLLNPYGFYLSLKAKTHKAAHEHQQGDTAGNLAVPTADNPLTDRRGNLQPFTDPAWELPSGLTDDDARTSIARRIDDKIMTLKGTEKWHWLVSADDPRLNRIKGLTYYGHVDDEGSPGHIRGGALPVSLSSFRPALEDGAVVIRWVTQSELDNAGFNILRSDSRNGEFKQVNPDLIQGAGTTGEKSSYKWVDPTAKPGDVYYYQIEDVSFAGERQTLTTTKLKGLISAKNKLTTRWGELKSQD